MNQKTLAVLLSIGIFFSVSALIPTIFSLPMPGNNIGYEPEQPIAFSHRLHAGELNISCLYCHSGAEHSRHAGVPSVGICMNCHKNVTASWALVQAENQLASSEHRAPRLIVSPEIQKIHDAMGFGPDRKPDANKTPKAIAWKRIHQLPDFACFNHSAHVITGMECQTCHGPVQSMDRIRQVETLSMGWCVNCHREYEGKNMKGREVHPTLDCAACHQ